MPLDLSEEYNLLKKKVESTKKYKEVKKDIEVLKKESKKKYNDDKKFVTEQLSDFKEKKRKYQKQAKTQFDELLELKFISDINTKTKTGKFVKQAFVEALIQIKPKIQEIVAELATKAIGCAQNQTFVGNQTFYIKITSFDIFGILKLDPDTPEGKITFEPQPIQYSVTPFTMNKELYNRIQNPLQPFSDPSVAGVSYRGKSGQELFDFSYVTSYVDPLGNTVAGDFLKVVLKNRVDNKVDGFIKDYYSSIDIFDYKNFFKNLFDQIYGVFTNGESAGGPTINTNISLGNYKNIETRLKFLTIIKRLLGVCNDAYSNEISVSGIAKVSELEEIDESYFEFSNVDLTYIYQTLSDIQLGVYEFVDCDISKITISQPNVIEAINSLNFVDGSNNTNTINDAVNLTDVAKDDGNGILKDFTFLSEFPRALISTILSPKTILPLMIMGKSLGKPYVDQINGSLDFLIQLKKYSWLLIGDVVTEFIKILFALIKKDLLLLVQSLEKDINKELKKKEYERILIYIALIYKTANLFFDYKKCRNIVDDLLAIVGLVSKLYKSRAKKIPFALLVTSRLLRGFSANRAFLRTIEKFDELGIPTGPMPDGSPNLYLASVQAIIEAFDEEKNENEKVQVAIEPLTVLPIGITTPSVMFGKST